MKAPKHRMSNSSLQPSGYGTEKEDKSKRAFLWDTVSTSANVLHLIFHQRLQTADEVLEGLPRVSQEAGRDVLKSHSLTKRLWEMSSGSHPHTHKHTVNTLNHKLGVDKET